MRANDNMKEDACKSSSGGSTLKRKLDRGRHFAGKHNKVGVQNGKLHSKNREG